MTLILAGSYKDYEQALKDSNLEMKDTKFGQRFDQIAGSLYDDIITTDSFWSLPRSSDLYDYAKKRLKQW